MARLPELSGRRAIAAFERAGFEVRSQRGSHVIMVKVGHPATLSVPVHPRLRKGTLRALIRKSGLSVDEFIDRL